MGFIGGRVGYDLLRLIAPRHARVGLLGDAYARGGKLESLLGHDIWDRVKGKTIIDFGCGEGNESIELASRGATEVIGLDIQDHFLERARLAADEAGVTQKCRFEFKTDAKADFVVSVDAFEHFDDPAEVLSLMHGHLKPGGAVLISFGPTWYHPLGGHLFSVFPWAHLIFSENALIRWRSDFKSDGAKRFSEVAGGLNQMTIRRFEKYVERSPLKISSFECVPIRRLKPIHNRLTREWITAVVRAELISR